MLIPLKTLIDRHGLEPCSVLHVGACLGEEAEAYAEHGFSPVWWVEGNADLIPRLIAHVGAFKKQRVVQALLSDMTKVVEFHVANNLQSSSYMALGTHKTEHPTVFYQESRAVVTETVDALFCRMKIDPVRLMSLDVQGAELDVLNGAKEYLEGVEWIYCEVNERELYVGCALLPELYAWLSERGFQMRAKTMTKHGWGDCFFARKR